MAETIINTFDIWTTARTQKTNGRGIKADNQSLLGVQKLRELILELAVRGKLVPQDTDDEPASILLEKIEAEKKQLIKEGNIKKQEVLPKVEEDEKPFDMPESWEWVRLGNVSEFVNGFAFKSTDFTDEGIGIVKIGDIQNGEISTLSMSRVNPETVKGIDDALKVNKGDLLIAMSGATTGKLGFNRTNEIFCMNQRVGKIVPHCLDVSYLFFPLTTMIADNLAKSMGSAIPNLSTAQIKDIVFALPPLAEQHRIVAKVDELMALCDQLERRQTEHNELHQTLVETLLNNLTDATGQSEFEEAWQRISAHFDTLFTTEHSIDQLKQTILQLAVKGKLVSQDPNDEPASELLKKIAKEKAQLVNEGKIKKQAVLPEITDDEKEFVLPEGWEWTRLGVFGIVFSGNSFKSEDFNNNEGTRAIKITNAGVSEFIETNDFLPANFLKEFDQYVVKENDIILALTRPYISTGLKVSKCPKSYNNSLLNQRVAAIRTIGDCEYAFLFLQSHFVLEIYKRRFGNSGLQPNLKVSDVTDLMIPVPPEMEQYRIVAKVNELFVICDKLKDRINQAQSTQNLLAEAVVEKALR